MQRKLILSVAALLVVSIIAVAAIYAPISLWDEPLGSDVARDEASGIDVEVLAEDLEAPWSIDFTASGDIFFTERPGLVRKIENDELVEEPLLRLPTGESEGGTLGIALDPNHDDNRYVYIYYTTEDEYNRVSRYRYNGEELVEESIIIDDIPGAKIHNGGRINFGPDGNLYIGTGDADNPDSAQDFDSLAGKILRIQPDGSIPADNPRADSPVYSMGHRNVQGLAWSQDGELYATEHGSQAKDKINLIESGANYGWPVHKGNIGDETPLVEDYQNPLLSSGGVTWAPSGATFYRDDVLPSEWHGKLLFAGLRSQGIWRLDTDNLELHKLFDGSYGRLRDIQLGPDGHLYILTNNRDGRGQPEDTDDRILRLNPEW